ncbi:hypothetical protein E2H20_03600 [Salmonella enterica subsp. enterica serovar Volkmarsdorf]|nr:hypothetical protein [Salmonella enterica subsp. enterica serovar Volkmarsdorf]
MTAHAAEFFTLDEVNRLKIIQDVVDRRLTTLMAAQRLGIKPASSELTIKTQPVATATPSLGVRCTN